MRCNGFIHRCKIRLTNSLYTDNMAHQLGDILKSQQYFIATYWVQFSDCSRSRDEIFGLSKPSSIKIKP